MSSDFKTLLSTFEEFKLLFEQSQPPLDRCKDLMAKLKVAMTRFAFPGEPTEEEKRRLFLCREILEYALLLSIRTKDIASFERYFAQIKTYYYDYGTTYSLPVSSRQYMILGLNLLRLLAKNKLAEFHTELELIPLEIHQQNVFIKHPVYLEQCMMEGAYNKVIKARSDVPSETYSLFMDMLMETVRNEIADCNEKAFNTISVTDAQKLLGFTDASQLKSYAESVIWVLVRSNKMQRNWAIVNVNGTSHFSFRKDEATKAEIPAEMLIKRSLHYAKELERIV